MTTREFMWTVNALINRPIARNHRDVIDMAAYYDLCDTLDKICAKADDYDKIKEIVEATDFIGEDFGYREAVFEIADIFGYPKAEGK